MSSFHISKTVFCNDALQCLLQIKHSCFFPWRKTDGTFNAFLDLGGLSHYWHDGIGTEMQQQLQAWLVSCPAFTPQKLPYIRQISIRYLLHGPYTLILSRGAAFTILPLISKTTSRVCSTGSTGILLHFYNMPTYIVCLQYPFSSHVRK